MAHGTPQEIQHQWQHIGDDKVASCYGAAGSMAFVASSAVLVRLLCRRRLKLKLSYDDYTILFALFLGLGLCTCLALSPHYGGSRHAVLISEDALTQYLKVRYAFQITYDVAIMAVKTSILLFYARVFPPGATSKLWRLILWICITTIIAMYFSATIVAAFQCSPIAFTWDKTIKGHCLDLPMLYQLGAAYNVATDLAILILPMPIVWHLQMPKPKKIAVTGVFLVGGLACIASIIRWSVMHEMVDMDQTWVDHTAWVWSVLEPCLGIFCACLPIMTPLLRHLRFPCARSRHQLPDVENEHPPRTMPKVSWLNSKIKMEVVWPGKMKKIGESSDSSGTDTTSGIGLASQIPKDEEMAPASLKAKSPSVTVSTE